MHHPSDPAHPSLSDLNDLSVNCLSEIFCIRWLAFGPVPEVDGPNAKRGFLPTRFGFVGAWFLEHKGVRPSLNNETDKGVSFLFQLPNLEFQVNRACVFRDLVRYVRWISVSDALHGLAARFSRAG